MKNVIIEYDDVIEKFSVIGDVTSLRQKIEDERNEYEEDYFVSPYGDDTISETEFNDNLDVTLLKLEEAIKPKFLETAIKEFPKKKNGTFKKNQVMNIHICNNSVYLEDSYGWGTDVLRFKAIDDTVLEMQYTNTVLKY